MLCFYCIQSMAAIYNNQWLLNALNDELDQAVFLLDTGPVWNKTPDSNWLKQGENNESAETSKCVNAAESAIVVTLTHALLKVCHFFSLQKHRIRVKFLRYSRVVYVLLTSALLLHSGHKSPSLRQSYNHMVWT